MGAGIYVREAGVAAGDTAVTAGLGDSLGDSPMELMQARAMLEGALMAQASVRATPEGLRPVREALDEMRQAMQAGRSALDADRRFHVAVAALAGNAVLERLVAELFDGRYSPITLQLSAKADTRQTWQDALREHERILQALEARDPLAAQVAMQHHLLSAHERWAGNGLAP
jgi:GntR family transcriptional repressor for pyruvate dehydrogenase complex